MGHTPSRVMGEVLYENLLVRYSLPDLAEVLGPDSIHFYAPFAGGMITYFSSKNFFNKKENQVLMADVNKGREDQFSRNFDDLVYE